MPYLFDLEFQNVKKENFAQIGFFAYFLRQSEIKKFLKLPKMTGIESQRNFEFKLVLFITRENIKVKSLQVLELWAKWAQKCLGITTN